MAAALEVDGVVARYGERTILDGVSMTVQPGEVRVILGGSGCGKSTLLKCCVGLKPPDAGRARMLGQELTTLSERDQRSLLTRVGVLFQYGALLGSITIGENVALPLREHTDLPPDVIEIATNRPLTITPSSMAPSAAKAEAFEPEIASTPKYATKGASTGSSEGMIISRIAALVSRSTALP